LEKIITTIETNAEEAREDFIAAFSAAARVDLVLTQRALRVVSMEKPVVTKAELISLTITNREMALVSAEVVSDRADVRRASQEVVVDPLEVRVRLTVTPVQVLTIRTLAKTLTANKERDNQMIRQINQKTKKFKNLETIAY
jgi:hypothetical protein